MIAEKYDMTVGQLKVFNRLKSSNIHPGMKLKIKAPEGLASNEDKGDDEDKSSTYKVRRGDSLHDIAKRFGMSVHSLKRINKLRSPELRIGQVLRVAKNT